ncbi:MAG: uridylate kinase [Thermoanaerobaculia bacterium]|nr:uridylate kinase [Thermoanaerobaculia bacterium]
MSDQNTPSSGDQRHHMSSFLMRESLIDKDLQVATETDTPTFRMLPDAKVVKIGGRSVMDQGRTMLMPVVDALGDILAEHKLIIGCGGGARTRHVFSIGMDLGLPTGVLAQLSIADALGNAHILGTLLAPHGVVAIPPEIFGHLLPFFLKAAPGVIMNGDPPYAIWEHPPDIGRVPPHRTDAGSYLVAECFGCETFTLVKDVDGLYTADPKSDASAELIRETSVSELRDRGLPALPFDEVLLRLLERARLVKRFQIVNGSKPELLRAAIEGEHVGTIVHSD